MVSGEQKQPDPQYLNPERQGAGPKLKIEKPTSQLPQENGCLSSVPLDLILAFSSLGVHLWRGTPVCFTLLCLNSKQHLTYEVPQDHPEQASLPGCTQPPMEQLPALEPSHQKPPGFVEFGDWAGSAD